MSDELFWLALTAVLTAFEAVPYILERIGRIGLMSAMGYNEQSGHGDTNQPSETPPHWACRAYRAHINSVENLAAFATLVLIAHITKIGGETVACAAMVYFFARIAHYVVYVIGIPVLRTLTFATSLGALLTIAYVLLTGTA